VFLYNIDQVFVVCTEAPVFGFINTDIDIRVSSCDKLPSYLCSIKEVQFPTGNTGYTASW
jgi:hypothetical protein